MLISNIDVNTYGYLTTLNIVPAARALITASLIDQN